MSWMEQLVQTYDENAQFAGQTDVAGQKYLLPPVGHMTVAAQISMTLDGEGNLLHADVVPKDEKETLIPCTPDSASRTSSPAPHPLHDNLQYVARDYDLYAKKKAKEDRHPYTMYKDLLGQWVASAYSHPKVKAVYAYIGQHDMIADLVEKKILYKEKNGAIMEKWQNKDLPKPEIFSVVVGDILKSFVRFRVVLPGDDCPDLWKDRELQRLYASFIQAYLHEAEGLCCATGKQMTLTEKHYKGIRFSGDGAKLISSNDTDGFTFRGRFDTGMECVSVGYETSQKAMNALKWLVRNQGYTVYGKVFLAWGRNQAVPAVFMDTERLTRRRRPRIEAYRPTTMKSWAEALQKTLAGYQTEFQKSESSQVNVMILDAATPGRVSLCFYREMAANDFIDRIGWWHQAGAWQQHKYDEERNTAMEYFGVPAPKYIVEACYGEQVSETKEKMALERIFNCIIQGQAVPRDMEASARSRVVKKAIAAVGDHYYTWAHKILEPACSLVCNIENNKQKKQKMVFVPEENRHGKIEDKIEGEYTVALNKENTDRSYLYGRLLSVADRLERATYSLEDRSGRLTNAMKYMNIFSERPCTTWRIIYAKLQPYMQKREQYGGKERLLLDEITSHFNDADFVSDKPLGGLFLLGFCSQNYAMDQEIAERKRLKEERIAKEEAMHTAEEENA